MTEKFADQPTEGNIFLGVGVQFKGELNVPGCAFVEGTFEGALNAKALIVGKTGRVSGQISVETAEVRGTVGDNLVVQSRLVVRATGSISGSRKIHVAPDAAQFAGYLTPAMVVSKSQGRLLYSNADVVRHDVVQDVRNDGVADKGNDPWCKRFGKGKCPVFWAPLLGLGESAEVR